VFLVILLVGVRHLRQTAAQSIDVTTKLISSYSQVNFFIYDKAVIINVIQVTDD
jgi:hypothetical protein